MSILGTSCQYHGLTFVGVSRDVIVVGLLVRNYLACGGFTLGQAGFKSLVHRTLPDSASGCHVPQRVIE